jgi:aspartyl-tRNA(Asn)/glutamyl-tRNA(Gln) amidotransferase subunit C
MKISTQDVKRIATLARLALREDEVERYASQLSAIVETFDALAKVDTTGITAQNHAIPLEIPLREDEPSPSLPVDEALKNAPARAPAGFLVPTIVEK